MAAFKIAFLVLIAVAAVLASSKVDPADKYEKYPTDYKISKPDFDPYSKGFSGVFNRGGFPEIYKGYDPELKKGYGYPEFKTSYGYPGYGYPEAYKGYPEFYNKEPVYQPASGVPQYYAPYNGQYQYYGPSTYQNEYPGPYSGGYQYKTPFQYGVSSYNRPYGYGLGYGLGLGYQGNYGVNY